MNKLYTAMWIELPRDVRDHLMKVFGIVKTGVAEVRDQTVISDGVTNENLQVITSEKMSKYTGSPVSTDFSKLWTITVSKANYELNPPIELLQKEVEVTTAIQTEAQTAELNAMTHLAATDPVLVETPKTVATKFCDTCDSRGVFHLKVCPKLLQ